MKVGDGSTGVNGLPFYNDILLIYLNEDCTAVTNGKTATDIYNHQGPVYLVDNDYWLISLSYCQPNEAQFSFISDDYFIHEYWVYDDGSVVYKNDYSLMFHELSSPIAITLDEENQQASVTAAEIVANSRTRSFLLQTEHGILSLDFVNKIDTYAVFSYTETWEGRPDSGNVTKYIIYDDGWYEVQHWKELTDQDYDYLVNHQVTPINIFYTQDDKLYALKDTTWRVWLNSEYNNITVYNSGAVIKKYQANTSNNTIEVYLDGYDQGVIADATLNDKIVPGNYYTFDLIA